MFQNKKNIKLNNITKFYDEKVIDNISMNIEQSKVSVIIGPSGCGKTSFLNILAGLDSKYDGEISKQFKKIGYVFQEDRLLEWLTVKENINIVKTNRNVEKLNYIAKILEISELLNKKVKNLSGGQKQRVSIARAFYYDPSIILMDEPFKSLDIYLKRKIIEDLLKLKVETNITVVLVTHDVREALLMGDNIYIFDKLPTKIIDRYSIDIDYSNRHLEDEKIMEIEKKIYKTVFSKF